MLILIFILQQLSLSILATFQIFDHSSVADCTKASLLPQFFPSPFFCPENAKKLAQSQVCDGTVDCKQSQWDETKCVNFTLLATNKSRKFGTVPKIYVPSVKCNAPICYDDAMLNNVDFKIQAHFICRSFGLATFDWIRPVEKNDSKVLGISSSAWACEGETLINHNFFQFA